MVALIVSPVVGGSFVFAVLLMLVVISLILSRRELVLPSYDETEDRIAAFTRTVRRSARLRGWFR